ERFAAGLGEVVHSQVLPEQDLKQLEAQLALLEQRNPGAAVELRAALDQRRRTWREVFDLKAPFADAAQIFGGSVAPNGKGDRLICKAWPAALLKGIAIPGNARLEAEIEAPQKEWESIELRLDANAAQLSGYVFSVVRPAVARPPTPLPELGSSPSAAGQTLMTLSIRRNQTTLRQEDVLIPTAGNSVLRIVAE